MSNTVATNISQHTKCILQEIKKMFKFRFDFFLEFLYQYTFTSGPIDIEKQNQFTYTKLYLIKKQDM